MRPLNSRLFYILECRLERACIFICVYGRVLFLYSCSSIQHININGCDGMCIGAEESSWCMKPSMLCLGP